ncbi:MAG: L-serine ammonia-lyase [Rhizobiaceae bacterium]|nr:L-serine ammonia-lyase [Rhizobiaceae bacterium]
MFLSVFEIFKIGVGPSSSHTMGPMLAANRFVKELDEVVRSGRAPAKIEARLHGSLASTGKGHATDRAVVLGLLGKLPATLDPDRAESLLAGQRQKGVLRVGAFDVTFDPTQHIIFDHGPSLPGHPNGMRFRAFGYDGDVVLDRVFYSIGGGFIATDDDVADDLRGLEADQMPAVPYPFRSAQEMIAMAATSGSTIAELMRANEEVSCSRRVLDRKIDQIIKAMNECLDRGLRHEGLLPGGLRIARRAPHLYRRLQMGDAGLQAQPHNAVDWLHAYAMAVNEENAAGGRVVTAPTNGAAGVIPAVLRYYRDHCCGTSLGGMRDFLLTAAAIGGVIKHNASIAGAEMGCQGEVGSASSMAAAGLCAALGGSNNQIEHAAEIALEHHLGMTCDPVAGLVQVPCIERNGMGAIKAVSACSLALHTDGQHFMPLDNCIEAMRQTGIDMNDRYKETSRGGLAVNLPEC